MIPITGILSAGSGALSALREKAKQWAYDVQAIYNTDVPPSLAGEKAALLTRAKAIKETLESVLGTVDELAPMQLGFLPLVGGAAIAAAAAAVTAWYVSRDSFMEKVNAYNGLKKDGVPHEQAMAIVTGLAKKPSIAGSLSVPLLLIGGGVAFYFWRKSR